MRLAITVAMQELVSPRTSIASGRSASRTFSVPTSTPPKNGAQAARVDAQVVVRSPQPEVVEEDLVERVVVVLSRVDQDVLDALGPVEPVDHAGEPDDLRPRADDGHDLHARASRAMVSGNWSGLVRIEQLISPEHRHQVRVAHVADVVHPQGRHVDEDRPVTADLHRDDVVVQQPPELDLGLAADHEEALDLVQVVVLAARLTGPGRRHVRHAGAAVGAHRLEQVAPRVGVHRWDGCHEPSAKAAAR